MDERVWRTRTPEPGDRIERHRVAVELRPPGGATLISGDLDAALADLAPGAPVLGLLGDQSLPPYAIRIARDRALLCTALPLDADGWHGRFAASAADDLYLEFHITGPGTGDMRDACMSAPEGSPSAATLFGGTRTLVTGLSDGIAVRVERTEAAALWALLDRLAGTP